MPRPLARWPLAMTQYTVQPTDTVLATTARVILGLLVTLSVVAAFSAALLFVSHGGKVLLVQTASMRPMIQPGDAVIVWQTPPSQLQLGDIISYNSKVTPGIVITHRITKINTKTHTLTTQGDNTHVADPPISTSQVIGRATRLAPHLGSLVDRLRTPLGLVLAVYAPAALAIVYQARVLVRQLRSDSYTASGRW